LPCKNKQVKTLKKTAPSPPFFPTMPALFYLGASKLVVSAGQNRLANASRGRATVLPMRRPHAINEKAVAVDKVAVRVANGITSAPEKN